MAQLEKHTNFFAKMPKQLFEQNAEASVVNIS
jgi:hypothetical protein